MTLLQVPLMKLPCVATVRSSTMSGGAQTKGAKVRMLHLLVVLAVQSQTRI